MRTRLLRRLTLAALLVAGALYASPGHAAPVIIDYSPAGTGISDAPLSSGPSMAIGTNGGNGALTVYAILVRTSATSLTMACTGGPTATLQGPVSVASVDGTSGAIAMSKAAWTYPVNSSAVLRIVVAPVNDRFTVCTFGGAGAASSDRLTVYARFGGGS